LRAVAVLGIRLSLGRALRAQTAGVDEAHKSEITDVTPLAIAIANRHNPAGIEWNFTDDVRIGGPIAEDLHTRLAIDAVFQRRRVPCTG